MFPSLVPLQMPRLPVDSRRSHTCPTTGPLHRPAPPFPCAPLGRNQSSTVGLSGPQHPQGATELFSALTNQVAFCSELEKPKQAGHAVSCSCSSGGHTLFLGFVLY